MYEWLLWRCDKWKYIKIYDWLKLIIFQITTVKSTNWILLALVCFFFFLFYIQRRKRKIIVFFSFNWLFGRVCMHADKQWNWFISEYMLSFADRASLTVPLLISLHFKWISQWGVILPNLFDCSRYYSCQFSITWLTFPIFCFCFLTVSHSRTDR